MPGQSKPDVNTIWASTGEATPVPKEKQQQGYVEEIPFYDDFNGHMQQLSQFDKHVNQEGVAVWDALTLYPIGGCVKSPVDYNVYRAVEEHAGTPPISAGGVVSSRWVRWSFTLPEIMDMISQTFVGSVSHFATPTPPPGWLKANGAAVSRTTYARLFQAIGTRYGAGNGTTTFNLPEARGEHIRSLDDGRGIDVGRELGSWQGDSIKSHHHKTDGTEGSNPHVVRVTTIPPDGNFDFDSQFANPLDADYTIDSRTGSTGGTETRGRNVAYLACIKF